MDERRLPLRVCDLIELLQEFDPALLVYNVQGVARWGSTSVELVGVVSRFEY